jgi:hypothetical protein
MPALLLLLLFGCPFRQGGELTKTRRKKVSPATVVAMAIARWTIVHLLLWISFRLNAVDVAQFPLPRCQPGFLRGLAHPRLWLKSSAASARPSFFSSRPTVLPSIEKAMKFAPRLI